MANILLTEVCVRKCPYCFAKQYMDNKSDSTAITIENLLYIIDFLERSGIKNVSLLGGEPLLHTQIADIIDSLLSKGFVVSVFTSGIMPLGRFDAFVDSINAISKDKKKSLSFIVNVNEPRFSLKSELEKVHSFLSSLNELCSLSFNIYRLDYDLQFLIDYILRFGLRRRVRFGIANPIPGIKNECLHPADFKKASRKLVDMLGHMNGLDITPNLDCGFPLCMFSDDDIGKLFRYTKNSLSLNKCGPALDIGPDLTCWSCFPLSNVNKVSLKDFGTYDDLYKYFDKIHQEYRKEIRGIYIECDSCRNYKDGICSGGCLAHIVNRFHNEGHFRDM